MTEYDKELQTGTPEYEEAMKPKPGAGRAAQQSERPGSNEEQQSESERTPER